MAMLATGRRTIIAAIGGFHGKSLGSLSATSKSEEEEKIEFQI
jgi:4-aminobutyrate aminotransferase-like enzyme